MLLRLDSTIPEDLNSLHPIFKYSLDLRLWVRTSTFLLSCDDFIKLKNYKKLDIIIPNNPIKKMGYRA